MQPSRPFGARNFDISPPPRRVPLAVRTRVLFGGFLNQFGWAFFGFGMIFAWAFLPQADLSLPHPWKPDFQAAEAIEGIVNESWKTNASEGGSDHNDGTPIFGHRYTFTGPDGKTYHGVSYATGRQVPQGETVTVEYVPGNPAVSRVSGMRTTVFGRLVLFVLLFPLVGLAFLAGGLRKGLRGMRLLGHGNPALGTLKSKAPTNVTINKMPVYKLTFAFKAEDGIEYNAVCKTHQTAAVEDDERERLLYDPVRPGNAVLLDSLPGAPRIDDMGHLVATGNGWWPLLLPAAAVAVNALFVYLRFFRQGELL